MCLECADVWKKCSGTNWYLARCNPQFETIPLLVRSHSNSNHSMLNHYSFFLHANECQISVFHTHSHWNLLKYSVFFFFNLIVRFSSLSANGRIEIQIGIENGMCSSGKSGRHPICSPTNVMDIFTRMSLSKFCTYSLFFMMLLFGFIFRPTVFFFLF